MKTKQEVMVDLLDQIIQASKRKDQQEKIKDPTLTGNDWVTFHLEKLRDLIITENWL